MNLRDRIAAAIYENGLNEWDKKYVIDPRGLSDELKDHTTVYRMADAVIAELGLRREDNEADYTGPYRHRYVTDWKADDEDK